MKRGIVTIMAALFFLSCTKEREVELVFRAYADQAPLGCDTWITQFGPKKDVALQVKDFRFFVSNIRMITEEGEEVRLNMINDGKWQYNNIALLDFENGTGECREKGTPETNTVVRGNIKGQKFKELVFNLGIPKEYNHTDNASMPSPLNLGAMFWSWQSGYKFARFDFVTNGNASEKFWFIHLGSTGCTSIAKSMPPSKPCLRPNLPEIHIKDFNLDQNAIVLDLNRFLQGLVPETCMSDPSNGACATLFERLGMSLETGACFEGCGGQQIFSKEKL